MSEDAARIVVLEERIQEQNVIIRGHVCNLASVRDRNRELEAELKTNRVMLDALREPLIAMGGLNRVHKVFKKAKAMLRALDEYQKGKRSTFEVPEMELRKAFKFKDNS